MQADDYNKPQQLIEDKNITLFQIESLLAANQYQDFDKIITQQSQNASQLDKQQQNRSVQKQLKSQKANIQHKNKQYRIQNVVYKTNQVDTKDKTPNFMSPLKKITYMKQQSSLQDKNRIQEGDFFRFKQHKYSNRTIFLMKRQIQYKNREAKIRETMQKDIQKQKKAQAQRRAKGQQRIKKASEMNRSRDSKMSKWKLHQQYLQQLHINDNKRVKNTPQRMITQSQEQIGRKYRSNGNLYPNNSLVQQARHRQSTLKQRTRQKFILGGNRSELDGSIYSQPIQKSGTKQQRLEQRHMSTLSPEFFSEKKQNKFPGQNQLHEDKKKTIDRQNQCQLSQQAVSYSHQTIDNGNVKSNKKFRILKPQSKQVKTNKRLVSKFDQVYGLKYEQCETLSRIRRKMQRQSKQSDKNDI